MLILNIVSCKQAEEQLQISAVVSDSDDCQVNTANFTMRDTTLNLLASITVLFEDSKGNIWFGTDRKGVCKYDGKDYTYFEHIGGVHNYAIQAIGEDKDAQVWFQTEKGLTLFTGEQFRNIPASASCGERIASLPQAQGDAKWSLKSDDLWFSKRPGAVLYQQHDKGINYLNLPKPADDSLMEKYSYNPYQVYSILKDKNGHLWLGTLAAGLVHYNGDVFSYIMNERLDVGINHLFEDRNGDIWVGTNGAGVYKYGTNGLINFSNEQQSEISKRSLGGRGDNLDKVFTIMDDKQGNIWFGTLGAGLWKYDGTSFTQYMREDGLPSTYIISALKQKDGTLVFGCTNGAVFSIGEDGFELWNESVPDDC
jgi:ligand-binding sensor domain-containing protein